MKPINALFTLGMLAILANPAWADHGGGIDTSAILGGALGGGAGAAVGSAVGGRDGAIIGAAIGGAAGTAVATRPVRREVVYVNDGYHDDHEYRHDNGLHRGHYKHKRKHKHEDDDD